MSSTQGNTTHSTKKRLSISLRLPLLFIASFLVVIIAVVLLVYIRFENRLIDEYSAMGKSATMLMAQEINPDHMQIYIEENFASEEYNKVRERLIVLKNNYPDVMYMYVYHFIPEGGEVIFDLDSEYSLDADPPGTIYEPDPAVVSYMEDLCAGKEIPVLTGDTTDGYMLTYMRPVHDSQGNYCCHVCVDFSMEKLHKQDIRFVLSLLTVLIILICIIAAIDIHFMRKTITGPLNQMKQATDKFSYDNETDHQNNIDIMENLNINTGDEIEDIYHLFITFMKNNLDFMRNLSRAENDIKFKNSQIGKISNAAYKDSLTGVRSKAAYNKMVEELNKEINVGKKNFAVVMIDLNNLKKINDEFGHEAGDSYIKGCCQIICDVFKPAPIYRIGGDEFVVILRGTNYANRHDLIDSIKKAYIDSFKNETADPWLRYSAAVGSADCSSDDVVFETIFKRADKAMYDAKKEFKSNYGSYR